MTEQAAYDVVYAASSSTTRSAKPTTSGTTTSTSFAFSAFATFCAALAVNNSSDARTVKYRGELVGSISALDNIRHRVATHFAPAAGPLL